MKRVHAPVRRQRFTAQQRRQLLDDFASREVRVSDFAAQQGIGTSTLFKWLRQRRSQPARTSDTAKPAQSPFQQVSLAHVLGPGHPWAGEVQWPDGTQLRWSSQTPPAVLGELLAHLRPSC